MGLLRRSRPEPIETLFRPYAPAEALDLHTPRFGGPEMSEILLDGLGVSGDDRIVEIWPSFGRTTEKLLRLRPRWYRGIAADHDAVKRLDGALRRAPDLLVREPLPTLKTIVAVLCPGLARLLLGRRDNLQAMEA